MAARLTVLLPRLLALTVIWLLGAATFTLAAEKKSPPPKAAGSAVPADPKILAVPDVRGKAYVFAKGILQDAGFAWRVKGSVQGYAANSVAVQSPAPGSRVVDNGAPTVVLRLLKNSTYGERGLPENDAPYPGTRAISLSEWREQHAAATGSTTAATTAASTTAATTTAPTTTAATTTNENPSPKPPKGRKPDFVVPGAPAEPADEMPLPARARMLEHRVGNAAKPTRRLVDFWLYQHAWIVTGARFGWHDGAEALRILVRVDKSLERRFGFGARSEAVARRALAYVEAKSK
jgi:PASTA domain